MRRWEPRAAYKAYVGVPARAWSDPKWLTMVKLVSKSDSIAISTCDPAVSEMAYSPSGEASHRCVCPSVLPIERRSTNTFFFQRFAQIYRRHQPKKIPYTTLRR